MTDYTKTTDFTSKDSLPSGDSGKIIRGAEFGTEFDNIETAVNSKSNIDNPSFTGNITVTGTVDGRDIAADGTKLDTIETSADVTDTANVTAAGAVMDSELTDITAVKALNQGVATTDSPTFAAVTSTGNVTVGGTVDGRDVAADGTKLDTVETNADVTDTTNVTAAGALMDSEVTNLDQVKAFDSADYATAAQGTTADNALPKTGGAMTGAITTNSTFDGRDVATDGTKLDGIEAGATADQTASEIKTAYESNANTNAFTDADESKLDGIEASADVTDTTNVTAAGALMDSELTSEASVKALNQGVATTDSPTFDGLTVDSQDVVLATFQRDGGGSSSSFGGYAIKFNAENSQFGDNYFLGVNVGGGFNLSTDSSGLQPIFTATSTGIDVNGTVEFNGLSGTGAVTVTDILDQDNMSSNSATALATQQSIKSYVDSQVATSDTLAEVLANGNATGGTDVAFGDNDKAIFGAGSDLNIYHNPSVGSIIEDTGAGALFLRGSNSVQIETTAGVDMLLASEGGAVTLNYDGSAKLATTSTGIDVTGTVTADGLTVDGDASVAGTVGVTADNGTITTGKDSASSRTHWSMNNPNGEVAKWDSNGTDLLHFITDEYKVYTAGNKAFEIDGNGDISFYEDTGTTAKLFWDASAESLGIGTSSPSSSYAVDATSGFRSSAAIPNFTLVETDASNQTWQINSTAAKLSFRDLSRAADRIVVDTAGNVGIGTSSPDTMLHLSDTAGGAVIRLERNDLTIANTDVYGEIQFEGHDASAGSAAGIRGKILGVAEGVTGEMALAFQTASGYGSSTERMRIDSAGNLLVGTTDTTVYNNSANSTADNGFQVNPAGWMAISAYQQTPAFINRTGNDGSIISFTRSGSAVGSIGVDNSIPYFLRTAGGIAIGNTALLSVDSSGTINDNAYDLGGSSNRFKHLYLSGDLALTESFVFGNTDGLNLRANSGKVISMQIAGSEKARIDSSGNLLVGGTSAFGADTITLGTGGFAGIRNTSGSCLELRRDSTDGSILDFQKDGTTVGSIGAKTDGMYLGEGISGLYMLGSLSSIIPWNAGGNTVSDAALDLGLSTRRFKDLHLSGTATTGDIYVGAGSATSPSVQMNDTNSGLFAPAGNTIAFSTAGGERARIDSSGNLFIGLTAEPVANEAGLMISPVGFIKCSRNGTTAKTHHQFFNDNGVVGSIVTSGTTTTYNTSSDVRLKGNIADAEDAGALIDSIQVRQFDWVADGEHQRYGMVAQELNTVAPEAVFEGETEGDMMGVDYSKLVPMLVKEIQSLRARVAQLETN